MTDGSVLATLPISSNSADARATPNGQHFVHLVGDNDHGPFRRYSRAPVLEDEFSITDFYTDLQDWSVDDAYDVYAIKDNVLYRYDANGTEIWSVDLNADYGYRWPSRASWTPQTGSGQTIIADGSTVKVCGYIGPADWTDGSYGVVLEFSRASGVLISQANQVATGGNAGAQTIAMCKSQSCLWLAGAADGTDFEEQAISGVAGWIMKVPLTEGGGLDFGEDI